MKPLPIPELARVTVLTGAGVSVASGIPPYRGPGGIWGDAGAERWVTAAGMLEDSRGCWRAHRELARRVAAAAPSVPHHALAEFERRDDVGQVTVLTQNVDSLHARAGSSRVVELHGSLARVRCTDAGCGGGRGPAPRPERTPEAPDCPRCGEPMRYDVVLFDEPLDAVVERAARDALADAEVFLAVGTSGVVYPAAGFARSAKHAGARTVLVNLEAPEPANPYFDEVIVGRAEDVLHELLGVPGRR